VFLILRERVEEKSGEVNGRYRLARQEFNAVEKQLAGPAGGS